MTSLPFRDQSAPSGPIDFILPWVDGSDPAWCSQRDSYLPEKASAGTNACRFRDGGTLRYWFRGVERFAPWVNNVYFITWGHVPEWLNLNHPKLKIVRHEEYIPHQYLPTFNSNVIELNAHRIQGLSENFVLFNDDTFLISECDEKDFFVHGLPRDEMIERAIIPSGWMLIDHTKVNITGMINQHFSKREVHRRRLLKSFNPKYGLRNIYSISSIIYGQFMGFRNPHIPMSHLKSTFEEVWAAEEEELSSTSSNKFRTNSDLNHWLMRYWNLCSGRFVPRSPRFGRCYTLPKDIEKACKCIRSPSCNLLCINDSTIEFDFDNLQARLLREFDRLLPDKSQYEL